MLITPLFVRSSFLLTVIALFTNADYPIVVRSSFLLKVIVLSTNVDYNNTTTSSNKDERTTMG
jgi:hypothetical protein